MSERKFNILCVDDDPDVLEALQLVLTRQGYDVATALSAEEGLQRWRAVRPDLVIVDLMMEEVDSGAALVRNLKAAGNASPVYMLSSVGDTLYDAIDYNELGLAGVFQKPIDHEHLITVLRSRLKA